MAAPPSLTYNNLRHIHDIELLDDTFIKDSAKFFPDKFGVSLLHKHFNLNDGECVVTEVGQE